MALVWICYGFGKDLVWIWYGLVWILGLHPSPHSPLAHRPAFACCARPGIEPGLTSRLRVQIRIVPPAETEKTRDKCADPPGAKTASPKSKVRARRRGTLFKLI